MDDVLEQLLAASATSPGPAAQEVEAEQLLQACQLVLEQQVAGPVELQDPNTLELLDQLLDILLQEQMAAMLPASGAL